MLNQESNQLTAQYQTLLNELAQNDELRAELTQNPAETLQRFGLSMPDALANVTLPTKEALAFYLGGRSDQGSPTGPPPWVGVHV